MKKLLLFFYILLCALLPLSQLCAQQLPLTDLLHLYTLDSSAAKQFCADKNFGLTDAKNDGATKRYEFAAGDSSGARLEMRYPNDSASVNVQLNYWFTNAQAYAAFRKAFKKHGFILKATKNIEGSLPARAETYILNNQQIELISGTGSQPYWLFLHGVGGYTW